MSCEIFREFLVEFRRVQELHSVVKGGLLHDFALAFLNYREIHREVEHLCVVL